MAREKKIVKYAPQTKMPAHGHEWRVLNKKAEYANLDNVMSLLGSVATKIGDGWLLRNCQERVNGGLWTPDGWKEQAGNYMLKRIYNRIWPETPEYKEINDAFMAEYDSREDLQELYAEFNGERYFLYDQYGNSFDRESAARLGYDKRPACYLMYANVIAATEAGTKMELNRPTPYQEGDIVVLRKHAIGRRYVDPLFTWGSTPDSSVERIGTVMLVTEKTGHWRGGKGSKSISVLWFGKEEASDIEERHIKWHERPTFKNGLKSRE